MSDETVLPLITPAQRLLQARLNAGFKSARKFAKVTGISYPTYYADENGTRIVTPERAELYAPHLRVSADFILNGNINKDLLENGHSISAPHAVKHVPLVDITDLKLIRNITAGRSYMPQRLAPSPAKFAAGSKAFAFEVPNSALANASPRPIMPGDIAYIDPDAKWDTGDIVAAIVEGHPELLLRKYRQIIVQGQKNAFELTATSDDFQTLSSLDHKITIRGRLAGLWIAA